MPPHLFLGKRYATFRLHIILPGGKPYGSVQYAGDE